MAQSDNDTEATPIRGSWAHWAQNLVVSGLIWLALRLPLGARLATFGWIFRHLVAPLAGYRKRARAQIAATYPDMAPADQRRLADRVAENTGRTFIELYAPEDLADQVTRSRVGGPGLQPLEEARRSGRAILLVTGHFGNHEAGRHALIQRGFVIGGLYRRMANPYFNDHYTRTMIELSGPTFEKGRKGTMGFARFLKSGGTGVLLFDLFDRHGEVVEFLDRPALTSTSAAELALRFDALLVPFFGERQADGQTFDIQFDTPIAHSDPLSMTREMTRALERRIARAPDQWFWYHLRWKPEKTAEILAQRD